MSSKSSVAKPRRRKRTDINVNRHVIAANKKYDQQNAVLTAADYKQRSYGKCLIIRDDEGKEVFRLVYRPDDPAKCGATVWGYTYYNVEVYDKEPPTE